MAELALLDVGHGSAAVLHEDGKAIAIDAGPGTGLLEFLAENKIDHLTAILISHADGDHIKGVLALLCQQALTIDSIHLNSDAAKATAVWQALAFELDERERSGGLTFHVQLVEGQKFSVGTSEVEILAPRRALATLGPGSTDTQNRRIASNTISAVARVSVEGSHTALLTGDLDEVGLEHLLETGPDLSCDVLVFPHHGGHVSGSSTPDRNGRFARKLLDATGPKRVVFSVGRKAAAQNPRPEIVAAVLDDPERKVMCTQMSVHCAPDGFGVDLSHLSSAFAVGRSDGLCCAGSIRLGADRWSAPSPEAHAAFVDAGASTPMCRKPQ